MVVEHWLNDISFQWDRRKAASNLSKHGVSFETACEAFFDPFLCSIGVEIAGSERRERLLGMTSGWKLVVVLYAGRGESFRLISARAATRRERNSYEER